MIRSLRFSHSVIGVAVFFLVVAQPIFAWSEHAMMGFYGLKSLAEIREAPAVPAESLESFLAAEEKGLSELLDKEEIWAVKNVPTYPARPKDLQFQVTGQDLKERFLYALRVHPGMRTPLYTQLLPGDEMGARTPLSHKDISVFKNAIWLAQMRFAAVQPGEGVKPLDIVASACDEPDFGLDIGLWDDSNMPHSKRMGFGPQPFGNPNLEYGTQAPIHIGFYHEASIIYLLAGFLKKTYPEMRIHQSFSLARYAFKTGHPYWGYRFMGWGMHYVQDLTQPYHARVLPGVGVLKMLWINILDVTGINKDKKKEIIQLISNRHLALENFQKRIMTRDLLKKDLSAPYWVSMQDIRDDAKYGPFNKNYPRKVLTKESEDRADELSRSIMALMPVRLVDDPGVEFEDEKGSHDLLSTMEQNRQGSVSQFAIVLAGLTGAAGSHPRNFARAVLDNSDRYDK